MNNELPLGNRTSGYRFFEMLPGLASLGTLVGLVVLSFVQPTWAAYALLALVALMMLRALRSAVEIVAGNSALERAQDVDWAARLAQLEHPDQARVTEAPKAYQLSRHRDNLARISRAPDQYPKPSELFNAVIISAYNEAYEVITPTLRALTRTTYDPKHMIVLFAYEERGGAGIEQTARRLQREFGSEFGHFELVRHPADLPNELPGKGSNITHAGRHLQALLDERGIDYDRVIVTTLDCDNVPHPAYFDNVTYEYIVHPNRKRMSFQPISLFLGNIWDAPAPSRVIANANSFWNIISSMRPMSLRNFASHAQPMSALVEMDFWSVRTIVEDGHQYWRSYFHFNGDYKVISIHVPIYQDAVLTESYTRTLTAQFKQLRRWAYGASDVPFVAQRVFSRDNPAPFWGSLRRFAQLLDSHVSLACIAPLIAFGAWVPFVMSLRLSFMDSLVLDLPYVIGQMQQVAMFGILLMIWFGYNMLPERPRRYGNSRSFGMIAQWVLYPAIGLLFNSLSAMAAQMQLLFGRYRETFDVTEKANHESLNAGTSTAAAPMTSVTARAA